MAITMRYDGRLGQRGERIRLHTTLRLTTPDGKRVAPFARCTNIGLGGLRVTAAQGLPPLSLVDIELRLPSGRLFRTRGHVAWLRLTLHPSVLGTPRGRDDDAVFGIAFDDTSTQTLLPIARLLVARDDERRRASRIRRLHTLRPHA